MTNIVLLDRDHESITIAWEKVPEAKFYEVQLRKMIEETASEWQTLTSSFKATFLRKKNLEHGVGYQFRLRSSAEDGSWSDFTTPSDTFFVLPSDFRILPAPTLVEHDANSITVRWNEVEGATGYRLRWRKEEDIQWKTIDGVLSSNVAKKNSLERGHNYYFAVLPLMEDESNWGFSASGGPFKVAGLNPVIAKFLPSTLLTKGKARTVDTNHALAGKVIAFYFSAHWCGPCRRFTPQLAEFYTTTVLKTAHLHQHFEVVFCSADNDEGEFDNYFGEMPWPAIAFDAEQREQLMGMFQVSGIPRLMVIGTNGQVLVDNAVGTPLTERAVEGWIAMNKGGK